MANLDKTIVNAAEKIAKGIEKGASIIASGRTTQPQQQIQMQKQDKKPESAVYSCPSCGHAIGSLDIVCPACGMTIEKDNCSSAAQVLSYNLSVIDGQKEGMIRNFVRTHQGNISDKAIQKSQMIKSFSVPNTKKDLLEFIHMAASNINSKILINDTTGLPKDADLVKS